MNRVWIQFEGVRCFFSAQTATLRPVTLLLGENSSGKSTFLALCQIVGALVRGATRDLPFNEPPFLLGAFDQIASYRRGRGGRAKTFTLEVGTSAKEENTLHAEFVSKSGQPWLAKWSIGSGQLRIETSFHDDPGSPAVTITNGAKSSRSVQSTRRTILPLTEILGMGMGMHVPIEFWKEYSGMDNLDEVLSPTELEKLMGVLPALKAAFGVSTYALSPIRTSPQRTYDPVSSEPKPEGSHVPMLLASLRSAERSPLWKGMEEFGVGSGLFRGIDVIRKGKKQSDPFQIAVNIGGPAINLADVGYGVSQVLPIIVDTLQRSRENETFLFQQPEVHLHPRAQAQLGTFFAHLAGKRRRFVVETHSDYLVDRIRTEVRRGRDIQADDVSILYFDRGQHGATVHEILLDGAGSLIDPPPGYRQFFLDEERTVLGI